LLDNPPPPGGELRAAYLEGFELKYGFGLKFPERERKRRAAEVRRFDAAQLASAEARLAEQEAWHAQEIAEHAVGRVRIAISKREEVSRRHAACHERRRREIELNLITMRLASARASEARCEQEAAATQVLLAAAEAAEAVAEAALVGAPVAQSPQPVVEGVLADGPGAGEEAGEEAGDDGMLI
jgi:hypothetical protein